MGVVTRDGAWLTTADDDAVIGLRAATVAIGNRGEGLSDSALIADARGRICIDREPSL